MGVPKLHADKGSKLLVLLVEDDPVVGPLVKSLLEKEGYQVEWVESSRAAREIISEESFHLFILDVNLPDGNGFDLCRQLRNEMCTVPVLILTSLSDEDSVVKGLALGANDYLRKPFGKRELIARVQLQLKGKKGLVQAGPLVIDLDKRKGEINGKEVKLTPTELQILAVLTKHAGDDVSREQLMNEIDPDVNLEIRTLDSHISHLRAKLSAIKAAKLKISSVFKVGYRLEVGSME